VEVERDTTLVAVEPAEQRRPLEKLMLGKVARVGGTEHGAEGIGMPRTLDLDHVRTEIAQQRRRLGAGPDHAEVDNPDAAQRQRIVSGWDGAPFLHTAADSRKRAAAAIGLGPQPSGVSASRGRGATTGDTID